MQINIKLLKWVPLGNFVDSPSNIIKIYPAVPEVTLYNNTWTLSTFY